jgi:hypothetical protein
MGTSCIILEGSGRCLKFRKSCGQYLDQKGKRPAVLSTGVGSDVSNQKGKARGVGSMAQDGATVLVRKGELRDLDVLVSYNVAMAKVDCSNAIQLWPLFFNLSI